MIQIVGILIAFALILIMVNRKIALGYALITGSIVVGFASGLGVVGVSQNFLASILDPLTIRLVTILAFISILGNVMQELGVLQGLVQNLNKVLRSPKLTITVIPSIMGSLLVTGGAIMAAPLVDEVGDELQLSRPKRAAINLIFRHGWYFIYPFMPAFILVSETANIDKFRLIGVQWPMTLVMILTGYFIWVRPAQEPDIERAKPTGADVKQLLKYSSPLWVSLGLAILLEKLNLSALGLGARLAYFVEQAAFPLALCVGISLAVYIGNKEKHQITQVLKNGIKISILMSGVGIMVFKGMVGQLSVISDLVASLMASGIPLAMVFFALPALTGFLSASSSSAIGITLPLLLPALSLVANPIPLLMLLFVASFLGYLISPLHLCQVLTLEYFQVKMQALYKEYALVIPATLATSIIVYLFIR